MKKRARFGPLTLLLLALLVPILSAQRPASASATLSAGLGRDEPDAASQG